ncbi:Mitochondrial inner membrane i-AAA protease supercomplex subunit MGR3 [Candida viswanathii]|uniref:Mitochondrial inner membrane i-AAA protease supercomplex subunit MGR3 n=1 Tax=Candida viswanathii TaxID=5486 RepID=A0A367YCP7_9ASCO|nr:Mitochondrial inner membrane i-AAA protease supercomplex subunit MGR3 [Candida viswanathii]
MSLLKCRLLCRTRQTNFLLRRRFSQYGYSNAYPPVTKTPWYKKLLYVTAGFGVLTGYAYYMWWPKHTFPSSVAKILRKGLWAESDRGEFDYQLALKHYLEALEHAQEIGLDPLSDEYTGIQLKIGEMFERLNMLADAAYIYNEIATLYLTVLTAAPNSEDALRIKDRKHRRHLIQKDLRIATKLVSLNATNPSLAKAILITHLIIAQDEVNKLMGPTPGKLNLINKIKPEGLKQQASESYTAVLENDEIVIKNSATGEESRIKKTPEVWEPFTDEFFNAMDLLSAVCISAGDLAMATKVKIAMNEAMLLADIEPSKMLLSQCNLGSLLYMQAEELEAQEIGLKRRISDLTGIDYKDLSGDQDVLAQNKLQESVPLQDQESFRNVVKSREVCLKLAVKSYESVLQFAKSFPQDFIKEHNEISETVAIATYGLGVINLHLSHYDKAERFLRESRVRARNCNYDTILPMIEKELEKLFNEKKLVKNNAPIRRDIPDIQMDITLK